MVWKLNDERPVYLQIMAIIQGAIITGEFASGRKIPSVRDLAVAARVNPNTMQRALSELERSGILISQGTVGRFITTDEEILQKMRREAETAVAKECAERFANLGIRPRRAAQLLLELDNEEAET